MGISEDDSVVDDGVVEEGSGVSCELFVELAIEFVEMSIEVAEE
jgi:hypothetical protein